MIALIPAAYSSWKRSLAKTFSWRFIAAFDTFVLSSLITGQLRMGVFIASAEVLTKSVFYYLHERGWARLRWGLVGKNGTDAETWKFTRRACNTACSARTS